MLRSTSHAEFKHPASYDRRRMRGSRTMGRSSSQRVLGNNITYGRPNVYPHVEPVTHSMLVEEAPLPRARRSTGRTPRDPITGVPMVSPQEYFAQTQAGRPIPYRSYYRSRNPSATRLAAADLGYGRFKTKTGESYDNMRNYSDIRYGERSNIDRPVDIINNRPRVNLARTGEGDNLYNDKWDLPKKMHPLYKHYVEVGQYQQQKFIPREALD